MARDRRHEKGRASRNTSDTPRDDGISTRSQGAPGDGDSPIRPRDLLDPEITGARIDDAMDGFHQPTAMFEKAEFLGELAALDDAAPNTRTAVGAHGTPPKGCRLIVVAGPDLGVEWSLDKLEIIIGRDESCELVLSDIAVSRRHARIALEGDHFVLVDLESGNGTFHNGTRIERVELSSGDEITIGERTLRFVELSEAPPPPSVAKIASSLASEPEPGEPSAVVGAREKLATIGSPSQIDVAVVPADDEPALPAAGGPPFERRGVIARGSALRRVSLVAAACVALAIAALVVHSIRSRNAAELAKNEQQRRARRELLQGIELVKQLRFGDASIMFTRVLEGQADDERAHAYLAHCKRELDMWKILDDAEKLATSGRLVAAIEALGLLDRESAYAAIADERRLRYSSAIAEALVEEARREFAAGRDTAKVHQLLAKARERSPGLTAIEALRREVEEAARNKQAAARAAPKYEIPTELARAVALYKNDRAAAAIDAVAAAGGPRAATWISRMTRVRDALDAASRAHRKKDAAELLSIIPPALEIDGVISGGEGKIRTRLEEYYADGFFLAGIEAFSTGDDAVAFDRFVQASRWKPGHKLAETRISELATRARGLWEEAKKLEPTNNKKARELVERILATTRPSHPQHKLAATWLREHG